MIEASSLENLSLAIAAGLYSNKPVHIVQLVASLCNRDSYGPHWRS